ncbi:Retrovirus-related Pol polyprotein from transposon TNT 1-94 [Bienertia sinuspersici]
MTTTIETSSPLYVHPSDGSGTIAIEKLQGPENYRTWKRTMEVALSSKRKLGFVKGTVVKDSTDPVKIEAWVTCNDMVVSWIMNNVNDHIKRSIMFMNTAKDMWVNLEQRFQVNNGSRRYQVTKQIYETKQQGRSVSEYFTNMQMLWQELEDLTVYPAITQMSTEMTAYVNFKHQQEEEQKLFQFLNGLDEINGAIRTNILMQSVLPTASQACSTIQQEESQRNMFRGAKEEGEALAMYGKGGESGVSSNAGNSGNPSCTVCGKLGHVKDNCWYVKGFPTGNRANPARGRGQDRGRGGRSFRGNRGGRFGRFGGNRDGGGMAANAEGYQETNKQGISNTASGQTAFTPQQIEQLLKMLPSSSKSGGDSEDDFDTTYAGMVVCCNTGFDSTKWVLDTGATHYMTDPANYVRQRMKNGMLSTSGGNEMKAQNADGLKVPDSLKEIPRMSEEMKWHQRLGHIPSERMRKISQLQGKVQDCKEECLICPQAKFTKLPFYTKLPEENDNELEDESEEIEGNIESENTVNEAESETVTQVRQSSRPHRPPGWLETLSKPL